MGGDSVIDGIDGIDTIFVNQKKILRFNIEFNITLYYKMPSMLLDSSGSW